MLQINNLHATVALAAMPLLTGCLGTTPKERAEIAAWHACIEDAIAERRDAQGRFVRQGRTVYFEVTYQCRALFPDLDQVGKSSSGRQLLNRVYNKLHDYEGYSSQTEESN